MRAGVLATIVEVGAGTAGCKLETWPWSAAFAAVNAASWANTLTIGLVAAAMFAVYFRLVATMVGGPLRNEWFGSGQL